MLARKNLMVEAEKVRRLARRLDVSDSEAVRIAVDRLLLEDEVMVHVARLRRHGGVRDVHGRTRRVVRRPSS